ncbi:hypothetical protein [Chlorogloeopsis fritschii]
MLKSTTGKVTVCNTDMRDKSVHTKNSKSNRRRQHSRCSLVF